MKLVCAGCVFILFAVLMSLRFAQAGVLPEGNVVKVAGSKGHWRLVVNGKVFQIKGAGVGRAVGRDGADYLKMAKELGANTVRTWGENQGDRNYLDTAWKYGLYVDAGIWLNPVMENSAFSYQDIGFLEKLREDILRYIRRYKDHPAVILWNIGNETIFWTKSEEERVAFCKFLEHIVEDVHAIDPNHPVLYTASAANDIPYLKKYVPNLDMIGINAYGGFDQIHLQLTDMFDVPYMVTEFGSLGEWSRNKDIHGVPFELTDESKMGYYKQYAHKIKSYYGYCLGGFVFYLGDTSQVSLTWWNINYGSKKKCAFLAMEDFYKDREYRRPPFVVKDLRLEKSKLQPAEEFEATVELKNVLNSDQPIEYSAIISTASDEVLVEYPNKIVGSQVKGEDPVLKVKAPQNPGIYRVYAIVSQGDYASTFNKSIQVISP